MNNEKSQREPKCFGEDEFARDPSCVMRRAEQDGSVVITDGHGEPRMRIGASLERPLVID